MNSPSNSREVSVPFVAHPALTAGLALAVDGRHPQVGGTSVEKDQEVLGWSSDADLAKVGGLIGRGGHRVDCLALRDPETQQLQREGEKEPAATLQTVPKPVALVFPRNLPQAQSMLPRAATKLSAGSAARSERTLPQAL